MIVQGLISLVSRKLWNFSSSQHLKMFTFLGQKSSLQIISKRTSKDVVHNKLDTMVNVSELSLDVPFFEVGDNRKYHCFCVRNTFLVDCILTAFTSGERTFLPVEAGNTAHIPSNSS